MKRQRKKYETPRRPWQRDVLDAELKLMGMYGLRNKRELWRAKYELSRIRKVARGLLSEASETRARMEDQLLGRLSRLGLLQKRSTLDDVLDLTLENLLERRLQTIVFRRGLAKTLQQARQFIVHGHIRVGKRRVTSPSYLVKSGEEDLISYWPGSPLSSRRE
jgi:small subunit ribosomal protein S4